MTRPAAKDEFERDSIILFEVHIQWSHHSHMSYLISTEVYTIKEVMIARTLILTIFPL